jgi:DNA-binding transcriptional LysR family regulator
LAGPQIPAEIRRWLQASEFRSAHRNLACDSYVLLKQAALCTDHIVGAPRFLFAAEVASRSLAELPFRDLPVWRVSTLVSRPASHSKVVLAFPSSIRRQIEALPD